MLAVYGSVAGVSFAGGAITPGEVVKIDPTTGAETAIWAGAAGTTEGPDEFAAIAVLPNGKILFDGTIGGEYGYFTLDPSYPKPTPAFLAAGGVTQLAVAPGGAVYGSVSNDFSASGFVPPGEVVKIDPTTGGETTIWAGAAGTSDGPDFYGAIAVLPDGKILFDGTVGGENGLFTLDPSSPKPTPAFLAAGGVRQLAVAPGGAVYGSVPGVSFASTTSPGEVVRIDPTTGAETTIWAGAAGTSDGPDGPYGPDYLAGFAVRPDGKILFDGSIGGKNGLFTLDPSSPKPTPAFLAPDKAGIGQLVVTAVPSIHPTSLQWNAKEGGADYTYSVTRAPLPQDVKLNFYWATGPTSTTTLGGLGKPVYSVTIPKGTLTVNSALATIPAAALAKGYTAKAHFLLAVADPDNTLRNFSEAQNVLAREYKPTIDSIAATYWIPGNKTLIGRFFQGVPVSGQVFTITVDQDLAAVRPSPMTLTLGPTVKLALKPEAGGDGMTYVSDPFNGTGGLKPADYQATVTAQLGGTTTATSKTGYDVVAQPKWFTTLPSAVTKPSFDASARAYTFALPLINVSTSTSPLFAMAGEASTWFAAAAESGVDAHVTFQVVTGLDPTPPPTFSGEARGGLTVLGQSVKSFDQTYSSLSTGKGPFSARINLDPKTLNIKYATFTYDDHGTDDVTLKNSHPIVRKPFQFDYEFDTSIDWTANVTIRVNADGSLGPSSLDFTAKDDDVEGTLTITDVSLLPTAVGKGLGVLDNILGKLKGIPGLLADVAEGALKDLGLLPNNLRASADVTGSFAVHGSANLRGSPESLTSTGAKFQPILKLAVPTATIQFDWLGETRDLPPIDLGKFLSLKLP